MSSDRQARRGRSLPLAVALAAAGSFAATLAEQSVDRPVRAVTDPGVVTTRQAITPAGVQSVFDGRVYGMAFGGTATELWVLTGRTRAGKAQLYRLDWLKNAVGGRWEIDGAPALQGLALDRHRGSPLVGVIVPPRAVGNRPGGAVRLLARGAPPADAASAEGPAFEPLAADLGRHLAGGPALATGRRRAVLPLVFENALAIVDADSGREEGRVKTGGVAPFGAAISGDGRTAWVSHWGGRWPAAGDPTLPTGTDDGADRVVVDARGIASTGTVARIDLDARAVTATVDVGLHPTTLAWDEARQRLYVANANSDSISVVDTAGGRVARTIAVKPFGLRLGGVAPTALAISADGGTLYAALGGFNAVAVLATADGALRGLIPTAWYPTQVALTPDGRHLAVATLLGIGSGAELKDPSRRYVHAYRGTVHVVPVPDAAQLASYTMAVAENNHVATARAQLEPATARTTTPTAVPRRAGDPSLIEHVVYIIKENRTYDQVFGDLPRGNGEPSFVLFGEDVAPNHRKLATEFVLLDNFYATGGNSGDGHQWVTQASETSYALWPGYVGRSYPFDGTDPIAYANTGFLWDLALARNKTVRVFGEYAGRLPETDRGQRERLMARWRAGEDFTREWSITAPLAPLNKVLAKNFPPYTQNVPDVVRAQIFLKALEEWRASGTMPNLVVLQLPSDHTRGATPEFHTAKAMVADNAGARADRRGAVGVAVLEEDGDPRGRGRRAERRRSRRWPSHGGPGDLTLRPPPARGLDVLRAPEHGQDHRADPRPADTVAVRPDRHRHARQLHRHAGPAAVRGRATEAVALGDEPAPVGDQRLGPRRRSGFAEDALGRARRGADGAPEPDRLGPDQGLAGAVSRCEDGCLRASRRRGRGGRRGRRPALTLRAPSATAWRRRRRRRNWRCRPRRGARGAPGRGGTGCPG
jgi:YVTN family beta-propeller protein